MTLRLSIVVPAFNAAGTIIPCLEAIRRDKPAGAELIVVDDSSRDATAILTEPLSDRLIRIPRNGGDGGAREAGAAVARGDVLLFIDSDVVIPLGTCSRVLAAFEKDGNLAAITGRLSVERQAGYFTDYKNLYMNYILGRLPDNVTFVYGSVFATRANAFRDIRIPKVRIGADTAIGLEMSRRGMKVRMLKDVEVLHLKKYTPRTFYRNDFMIPYGWAKLFIVYRGWTQLRRKGTGFAHSSKAQLASLVVSWLAVVLVLARLLGYVERDVVLAAFAIWLVLNSRFFAFLFYLRGAWYGLAALPVTFIDHLVMAVGAGAGFVKTLMKGR